MTCQAILDTFDLYTNYSVDLTPAQKLDLANDAYQDICMDRDWEWLRTVATGTVPTTVPYISLPTDFVRICRNEYNEAFVLVGVDKREFKVVPMEQRDNYQNMDGYCYIDYVARRLYWIYQQTDAFTYQFDYIVDTPDLDLTDEPIFDRRSHKAIVYRMALDFPMIDGMEHGRSYENRAQIDYDNKMSKLRQLDAYNKLMI